MSDRDNTPEDRFQPKVGAPYQRSQSFVTRILRQSSKAGAIPQRVAHQPGARLGRGHVAARFSGGQANGRRVTIKTRLVNLSRAGRRSIATHLRYIEREGVGREGEAGQAYGPATARADLEAFEARGRDDRHQFRFIVSPEDAQSLGDLRTFTRHLMDRVASDLGTRLDWVAVDHWNTDNPHTHVVLRGKDETGRDLVIARDYIAHGMRHRAGELATEWLGPRTEREILASIDHEVEQDRWTGLDRTLSRQAQAGHLGPQALAHHSRRQQLLGRLQYLQRLGLAREERTGHWHLSPDAERTLRTLGERGDILRTMQRAMGGQKREYEIVKTGSGRTVIGCLVAKGLAGELHDQGYLVIDGIDGKAHHLSLPPSAQLSDFPLASVIEATASVDPRPMDARIAWLAADGLYARDRHRTLLLAQAPGKDPEPLLDAHARRLEALRCAGIVERLGEGVWRVPGDLAEQGQRYDARRQGGVAVSLHSALPLERQITTVGATWLDTRLVGTPQALANHGFGAQVEAAMRQRTDFLLEQGLARRSGSQVLFARDLLATLRVKELAAAARDIEAQTGLHHRPLIDGKPVSGIYRRRIELASGRYALLDDGMGFSLVPWKPMIEPRLGQAITAQVTGSHVSWKIGRTRGPVIG